MVKNSNDRIMKKIDDYVAAHPDYSQDNVITDIRFEVKRSDGTTVPMKNKPSQHRLIRLVKMAFDKRRKKRNTPTPIPKEE